MDIGLQVEQHLAAKEAQALLCIAQNKELVDQFKRMQQAVAATDLAIAELECIQERRRRGRDSLHAAAVNQITDMSIIAQSQWVVDNQVKPIAVRISRVGAEPFTKRLVLLDEVERDALMRYWWHDVPASIKCLADEPVVAFSRYVMGNMHGVSSEDVK